MMSFTVMYPYGPDKTFDWDYYLNRHMDMIKQGLGPRLKSYHIEKGLGSLDPNSPAPYFCILHILVEGMDDIQEIGKMAPLLLEDIPNYTDSAPVVQIAEVIL